MVRSLQLFQSWHELGVPFSMSTQLTIERLVPEPSRLRAANANLDVFSTSADAVDVADHFSATLFYDCVGEEASVESFVTLLTWNGARQDVFHYGVKPESGHQTGIEHVTYYGWFPVHRCV